jgi:general stress protein 26
LKLRAAEACPTKGDFSVAENPHTDEIKRLAEMIKGIRFAMLTTAEPDGSLRSRPMATQEIEFDGDLWFFTRADSPKVDETEQHRKVNVSFSNPEKSTYVSTSGTAQLVRDRKKVEELWKPAYKVFFPKGTDDPELALLKITVEKAEYWDSASSLIGRAIDFARAYVSRDPSKLGEHAKVELR